MQQHERPLRRHLPRYSMQEPVDVTVLRWGVPHTLPGRSINLCERGIGAVIAGELSRGETVGLELHLPNVSEPMRTRAVVRYHSKLQCGMEFVGLSKDQVELLREWVDHVRANPETTAEAPVLKTTEQDASAGGVSGSPAKEARKRRLPIWSYFVVASIAAVAFWWHWNYSWHELESGLMGTQILDEKPQAQVPAEEMQRHIMHRVQPQYPDAARPANLRGIIVLDLIVGRDGSVERVTPLNGPEVLARSAENALRWWKFEPYRLNGNPTVVETTVAVEFKP